MTIGNTTEARRRSWIWYTHALVSRPSVVRSSIGGPMKLVTAIIQDEDLPNLLDGLTKTGFRSTVISSTGGFLRSGNSTVLVGVDDHQVGRVVSQIRERCRTRTQMMNPYSPALEPGLLYMPPQVEVEVGGAVIFVQQVERFERL